MVNKCTFIGNMGKVADVKQMENGHTVATFPIACTEKYKKKDTGETMETTEWVNVVAWDGLAEIIQKYTTKGSQLYVEGKFHTRSYEGGDGVKRYVTEIWAKDIKLLGQKRESAPAPSSPEDVMKPAEQPVPLPSDDKGDLPF